MAVVQRVRQVDQVVLPLDEFVQLASLAASSQSPSAPSLLRRLARQMRADNAPAARELVSILRAAPVRAAGTVVEDPVDVDSRLPLLRREDPVIMGVEPIFGAEHRARLDQI